MEKFLELGNRFAADSDWKDFALTKFCLCSMGILLGMFTPKRLRKGVRKIAFLAFIGTYIPLMLKVYRIWTEMNQENAEQEEV